MWNHVTSRRVALAAAGGLFAALSLSGAAQAITDTVFRYTTAKTGFFTIHVMAMAPDRAASADDYLITPTTLSTVTFHCFNTGVNLPHGATMTNLWVWYTSGVGTDPVVNLVRNTLTNGLNSPIVSDVIFDDSLTRTQRNFVITNGPLAKVNNARYAYGFNVCVGSSTLFYGARIAYTYNQAGD